MLGPRRLVIIALAALAAAATTAGAEVLPQPQREPLLTVSGAIAETNRPGEAVFDRAMLEALPWTTFETATIRTEGRRRFTGVPLGALPEAVGAEGRELQAAAINDYVVTIPASDAVAGGPIVAYEMDGSEMSVRDKGPLWIVYSYDRSSDYQTEMIYSRSIWQRIRIGVVE